MGELKSQKEYVPSVLIQISASVRKSDRQRFATNLEAYAQREGGEGVSLVCEEISAVDHIFIKIYSSYCTQGDIARTLEEFFHRKGSRRYTPFRAAWNRIAQTLGYRCCAVRKDDV